MGKIIVCCLTLVVEGFDKLHLILYRAGVILLNINMKWMITSQISSDLVKMWEKGGMQLSADGSLTPDATDWILGEQNKCADKILHIYLYDVLSMIWSSPKQFLHFSSTLSILERWNCIKGNGSPWMLADFHKAQINDFRHILAGWWFPYRSDLTF